MHPTKTFLSPAAIRQSFKCTKGTAHQKQQVQNTTGIQSVHWEPLKCTAMSMDFFDCLVQKGKGIYNPAVTLLYSFPWVSYYNNSQTVPEVYSLSRFQLLVLLSYPRATSMPMHLPPDPAVYGGLPPLRGCAQQFAHRCQGLDCLAENGVPRYLPPVLFQAFTFRSVNTAARKHFPPMIHDAGKLFSWPL